MTGEKDSTKLIVQADSKRRGVPYSHYDGDNGYSPMDEVIFD
jgi:hypothetical protein